MNSRKRQAAAGFSLVELLVLIAIMGLLLAMSVPIMGSMRQRGQESACATQLRGLGQAFFLYSQANDGSLPRSFHSGGAYREPGWAQSIAPYLGVSSLEISSDWSRVFNKYYRAPEDDETDPYIYSYGLNVHFELDPRGDDYMGAPSTWRKLQQVPNPSGTILLAEIDLPQFGDHVMAHLWTGDSAAANAVNYDVHEGRSNFLFADGHVESLSIEDTFSVSDGVNLWNPSLAR